MIIFMPQVAILLAIAAGGGLAAGGYAAGHYSGGQHTCWTKSSYYSRFLIVTSGPVWFEAGPIVSFPCGITSRKYAKYTK